MTFQWWHAALAAVPILPNLWSIWHVWSHDFGGDFARKVLWLVVSTFVPVLGGLIYIFAGRRQAGSKLSRSA